MLFPDDFSISTNKVMTSYEDAEKALEKWISGFAKQGYYSMFDYTRIPFNKIKKYCLIVKI